MKSLVVEKDISLKLIFADSLHSQLDFMDFEISFSLVTHSNGDAADAQLTHNVNFAKLTTLLECINNGIVLDIHDMDIAAAAFLGKYHNHVMVLPDTSEMTMLAALHKKMNTICSEHSVVEVVRLKDKVENIRYEYINTDHEYEELPCNSEWVTEMSYWQEPWWDRVDISTHDQHAETTEELQNWFRTKDQHDVEQHNTELFQLIEQEVINAVNQLNGEPQSQCSGQVVSVDFTKHQGQFKPKLV